MSERERYALFFDPEDEHSRSRTKQSFKQECDINHIMARWKATGQLDHVRNGPGVYADFSTATDYLEALTAVQAAQEAFNSLDAELRARFDNDPAKLIAFVERPENQEEARSLDLVDDDAGLGPEGGLPAPGAESETGGETPADQ